MEKHLHPEQAAHYSRAHQCTTELPERTENVLMSEQEMKSYYGSLDFLIAFVAL